MCIYILVVENQDAVPITGRTSREIAFQNEKVELLETIIKSISNRNFIIKNAIDWNRFVMGG